MGEVFSFGAEDRGLLIDGLSRRERPSWLRIVVHGDARALGSEIGLRVWQGRVIEATPPSLTVARALLRVALARSGRIEVRADSGPEPDLRTAMPIRRALADAEKSARILDALLSPLGGPAAVVVTRPAGVMRAAAQLGRGALEVANQLLDQPRPLGEVLARAADDLAAARALDQLRDLGVLDVEESAAEVSAPSHSAPSSNTSARPTERSRPPTLRARAPARPRLLEVPEPADEDGPELERALSESPRLRPPQRDSARPVPAAPSLRPGRPSEDAADGPGLAQTMREVSSGLDAPAVDDDDARPTLSATAPPTRSSAPHDPVRAPIDRASRAEPDEAPDPRPARRSDGVASPRAPLPRGPSELDAEAALGRSRAPWGLALLGVVILLLLWVWWSGRTPPPAPAPVAVVDPTPTPRPPPPPPPLKVKTSTPSAYSLSHPPPLAGPEADRRLREAERLIQAGRYEEADAILAPLRVSRAEDPLVWLLTGTLEIERDRLSDATHAIDRAITIDPKSYRGYILRGSIQQFQGSARSAVQSYRTALAISPAHPMSAELREVPDRLDGAER